MLRFAVDRVISGSTTLDFPLGTLGVNLSGAFLLGVVSTSKLGTIATVLIGAATLGSYTTFSTWMFESHRLGEDGQTVLMTVNMLLSVVLGFGVCVLGRYVGALL
jgi:fluoride exporter